MAALMRAHGGAVETLFFDDEGHHFEKPENQALAWDTTVDFFERHLLASAAEEPAVPPFSQDELRAMAAAAATLDERIAETVTFAPDANESHVSTRWEAWRKAAAGGDAARFARRLEWDGLDEASARRLLTPATWPEGQPLPAWTQTVADAVGLLPRAETPDWQDSARPQQVFEALVAPFVTVARARWSRLAGAGQHLLQPAARDAFEEQLLETLTRIATPTLAMKWKFALRQHSGPFSAASGASEADPAFYHRFVADMQSGGFADVLRTYPVLARLLGVATDQWIASQAEFAQRLISDWDAIGRQFSPDAPLGALVKVRAGLSDRHNEGRGVIACTFASGLKLIYKPRTVALEAFYGDLLTWVNEQGELLPLRVLSVLDRGTHGWVAYAETEPCLGEAGAARFYRRMGTLLGLLYGFHGTDCHCENVLACGEHPVVVDAEMLAVPLLREPSPKQPYVRLKEALKTQTVLEVGFLPQWERGPGGQVYDMGALTAGHPAYRQDAPDVPVAARRHRADRAPHLPLLHGQLVDVHDYADELTAGFGDAYRFLQRHREALCAPGGLVDALAHLPVRVIFRDTSLYATLLRSANDPRHLRDGMAHAIHLEQLAKGYRTADGARPFNAPMLAAERRAMARLDVPYFATRADRLDLSLETGEIVADCFPMTSVDRVRSRLASLGEVDLERQTRIARQVLVAHQIGFDHIAFDVSPDASQPPEPSPSVDEQPFEERATAEALRIAHELIDASLPLAGSGRTWLVTERLRPHVPCRFGPADYGLTTGHAGIAFFLGAVASAMDDPACRDAAFQALAPVREAVTRPDVDLVGSVGIGAGQGIGGIVYALTRLSQLLDAPDLLADAQAAARIVTPERIAGDTVLDLLGGSAGALLGLLALADATGDADALERARLCGRRLLDARTQAPTGHRVWETVTPDRLLAGMSHGAAGIAYALLRLHARTNDADVLEAGQEAIAYERALYDAEARNWPDLRQDVQPAFWTTWCHGAPGIGLARLGGLGIWEDDQTMGEIEAALATTSAHAPAYDNVHLCCGLFGRLDLLAEVGQQLGRADVLQEALRRAWAEAERARQLGRYRLRLLDQGAPAPTLFYGMAGIGYQLLRLARPDALPSVLRLA